MKRYFAVALVFLGTAAAFAASAGDKQIHEVAISVEPSGPRGFTATGSLGSARNSADANQAIGCSLRASAGQPLQANCSAKNAEGKVLMCSTTEPVFVEVIKAMSDNDILSFSSPGPTGSCTTVTVYKGSENQPPQL